MTPNMMTKWTLNALLAGGGLLATWFAVTPPAPESHGSTPALTQTSNTVLQLTADDLNIQETRLREHLAGVPLRPSARNPFRFGAVSPSKVPHESVLPAAAVVTPSPFGGVVLSLSGIFNDNGTRTAIVTGDRQLYLVKQGELVAGRYEVVAVDANAVTLRTDSGTEVRLSLR
jgi:hypothetical protein